MFIKMNEDDEDKQIDVSTPDISTEGLSELPTTQSGAVKKKDAMRWLKRLKKPSDEEIRKAVVPKPNDFSGSTYPTNISTIRLTGDPEFVETVAGLFKTITQFESGNTRVEVNLQETEDRDTGEDTGNYALYLSVAERG
jgi:hypothetical protein